MERNRESRRGAGGGASGAGSSLAAASRRSRASGPKDASDDDERMDETSESRHWERSKKERLSTFHVSLSGNPRTKRKRQIAQEVHMQGRTSVCDDVDESAEETENAASEDDDEPPPPIHRRPGKFRGPGKEDEIVMDIPPVPRKARSTMSSSSRFTANLRRQQESPPADSVRQQSPLPPQNAISSISHLGKTVRKLKPPGTKFRAIKVAKVPEPAISDQEAEVAEALFVLARSAPSTVGVSESRFELKPETKVEEAKAASPSPSMVFPYASGTGSSITPSAGKVVNGYSLQSSAVPPVAEAPKRKRPRVITKQEEGKAPTPLQTAASPYLSSMAGAMHSPVGELDQSTGCEKKQLVDDEHHEIPTSELSNVRIPSDTVHTSHGVEEEITNPQDNQSKGPVEEKVFKAEMQENLVTDDQKSVHSDTSPPNVKPIGPADILEDNEGSTRSQLLNRNSEVLENDGGATKMEIDLMAPIPTEPSRKDAEQPILKDPCIGPTSDRLEVPSVTADETSEGRTERRDAEETGEKDTKVVERAVGFNQEQKQEIHDQTSCPVSNEQMSSQTLRGSKEAEREKDKELTRTPAKIQKFETENPSATSFIPSALSAGPSSGAPVALASWMGGLPPLGYYGPGAPTWPAGGSLMGSNLDGKTAHPAMQPPHSAFPPPVLKMKRCATHVYVANFIQREQRHSLWSAALCRGTPYNLNFPSVNVLDNEKLSGAYVDATRKASAQQQSNGLGTGSTTGGSATVNSTSAASHSMVGGVSLEMGSGTASGNVMNMAHAQYLQALMQQNGYSLSFGPPGQAAHLMPFNGPFYPAHLMPPLPHLHSLSQQAPNMLPVQKQTSSALPHSSSQLLVPPMQQQQPQPFPPPRSPSSSQQQQHHSHIGSSAQNFGGQSEKDSGESHSTADSRLSAMQRSMCGQGLSNLPNLNISPSSLILTSSVPAMPSQHQDVSLMATLGGKPSSKSQQQVQFQSQQPSSLPPALQQQQLLPQSTSSGSGLQMKVLDPSASQGYSSLGLAGVNRGSGPGSSSGPGPGPGPLGLVSVGSMMASQGHGALPGGTENARLQVQQAPPQGFGGHNQQYQRTVSKSATSVSDDTFVAGSGKGGREFVEEKKPSVKQAGGPAFNLTRQDLESSLSAVQGFPTSGGGPSGARGPASNVGRTLAATAATATGSRNSRAVSSVGTGQVPLFQGQTPKQGMGRGKAASGANFPPAATTQTVPGYATLGKYAGTTFPFPGQMTPSSQGSKQAQSGTTKSGQRMSPGPPQQVPASAVNKSQGQQQVRSNPQGVPSVATPPRVLPSSSAPVMSSGTISNPTSNALSVAKAAVAPAPASKSPSNGKGSVSISKSGPGPAKKPSSVSGPTMASVMSPGQNIPLKNSGHQKGQPQLHPSPYTQQQANLAAQQQRLGPKIQLYAPQQTPQQPPQQQGSQYKQPAQQQSTYRPQMFLQHHQQQYVQQSSPQQQVLPQPTQVPSPHQYQQSSPTQHVQMQHHLHHDQQLPHHQQQLQPVSSPLVITSNNGSALNSSGLILGTGNIENISSCTSSEAGDQLQGSALRGSTQKASGNRLLSGGVAENMIVAALPGHLSGVPVSGQQVGSPSGSSHYLQLTPVLGVKPAESKTLPDCSNREEINNGTRHLSSPSPSQTPLIPNPSSA